MELTGKLTEIVGPANILTGADCDKYAHDWTGKYVATPIAVVRPGSTDEVSRVLKLANDTGTPVVPGGGGGGVVPRRGRSSSTGGSSIRAASRKRCMACTSW